MRRNRRISGTVYSACCCRFPPALLFSPSPPPIAPSLRVTPYKLLILSSSLQAPHFRAYIPQAHVEPLTASAPSLQVEHHRHRVCQVALPQVRESCHGRPVDDTVVGGPTDLQELAWHDVTLRVHDEEEREGKKREREREREKEWKREEKREN